MKVITAKHHGGRTNLPITRIVIHATCPDVGYPSASRAGRAESTARYFQSTSRPASAHYVCDVATTVQCLAEDTIGYHAPPNAHSIGIEICADGGSRASFKNPRHAYSGKEWLSPEVWPAVERAATLARQICERHQIPVRRLSAAQVKAGMAGICGHDNVSAAFHQSDHDDPGPAFPWDQFMAAVQAQPTSTTPPSPTDPTREDPDMHGCWYYTYPNDKRTITYMLFNEASGFYHEFSNGKNRGALSGGYVNPIAKNWDTGSWPQVTVGHAKAIKHGCDLVRKGA